MRLTAIDDRSPEAKEILRDFVRRSGAQVVGDLDPAGTFVDSALPLAELERHAGDAVIVERPISYDFDI